MTIPELVTDRLRLRAPQPTDLDECVALRSDPDVIRYIGGVPQSREAVWARLMRYIGCWTWMGFGYWIIERRQDRAFVGELGFLAAKRDITPPLGDSPEIGWVLCKSMHGNGYATEAARAALAWRETALPPGETVCIISIQNAPSLRLAARLGFLVITETTYNESDIRVLSRKCSL